MYVEAGSWSELPRVCRLSVIAWQDPKNSGVRYISLGDVEAHHRGRYIEVWKSCWRNMFDEPRMASL